MFAKSDFERGQELMKTGFITKQVFEQRKRNYDAAEAAVKTFTSQRDQAQSAIKNSEAQVERIQSIINDLTLVSPRLGRVQYQLARAGEVVAAGAPIVTILDLTDVYMTIFLPAADAGRLTIGDEARIILDPVPDYVIPAKISFVAADAQFTPKTVETKDERAKLMFRVKLKIDPQVLQQFYTRVKTGVRGMGFVRTKADVEWPADLQVKLPKPPEKPRLPTTKRPKRKRPTPNDRRIHRAGYERIAPVRRDDRSRRRQHRHSRPHHGRRDRAGRRRQVDPARADRRRAQDSAGRGRRLRQGRLRPGATSGRSGAASPTCRRASGAISIRR